MRIEIQNFTKTIQGQIILDQINLTFSNEDCGRIYGLQGINGSGKTMLMRAICGLILPSSGCVRINGKQIGKDLSFPPDTGLLLENPAFINEFTGFKNLKLLAEIQKKIGISEIESAMKLVGLDPKDRRVYRKYSLGMKQRLGIASAVMENPELVILDEPFNALDTDGVQLLRELILKLKRQKKLVILACHDKYLLEDLADVIIPIENGHILKPNSEV